MGSVRARKETGLLFLDYRSQGRRCREQTDLPDTVENRRRLQKELQKRERSLANTANPVTAPPQAPVQPADPSPATASLEPAARSPLFAAFIEQWVRDHAVEWRRSHLRTVKSTVDSHLVPAFGERPVTQIRREELLAFRTQLAALPGRRPGSRLSSKRINAVMAIMKQALDESSLRYGCTSPAIGIKRLKLRRTDVQPFSLEEVQLLIRTVRADYHDYILVRCFTGMRSGEVDGLQWKYIDFDRRLILIRETRVLGEDEYTKTDSSQREIQMSAPVYEALRRQEATTRHLSKYVFCNGQGNPIDNKNFVERVWNPLLRHLALSLRRPYQMRHTAATLWLAAGENPEWVARQLGHATTEMLFKVYSRYVPNLTRQDGSAFDRLLQSKL
jgi:integrase